MCGHFGLLVKDRAKVRVRHKLVMVKIRERLVRINVSQLGYDFTILGEKILCPGE